MANYSDLKTAIDVYIRNNGNGEITGDILNQVLKNMVNVLGGGYQFAGAATTGMNPGTPDNNVYYVTTTAGTYTNFGGLVVNDGELALLTYNGVWQKVAVTLPAGGGGAAVEVIDNLDSESTTSALSANQGRVLKKMINTNSGKKVYQFPAGLATSSFSNSYDFTEEEVTDFLAAVSDLANTDFVLNLNDEAGNNSALLFTQNGSGNSDGTQIYFFNTAYGQSVMASNDFDKIVTYTILLIQMDAQISGALSTSTLEVDTEISDTSMNPVQNKVIKEYVDNAVAGSGSGSGVATIYMGMGVELTSEQINHNIEVHNVFMDCYNNGGIPPIPQIVMESDGTLFSAYYPHMLIFDTTPIFSVPNIESRIALMADGTIQELT